MVLALLMAVALAIPRSASADSVVYVKGGNVWLASPDGSVNRQLTTSGAYGYASQSDNGVIVASSETRIHRLSRTGEIEADLPTVSDGVSMQGPFEPQISPNGKIVAYEFYSLRGGEAKRGTAYQDVSNGALIGDLQTGWSHPAWIDDEWTMQSGGPNVVAEDVIVRGAGEANNLGTPWFSHADAGHLRDGDITRKGDKLAFVAGENDEFLTIYRSTGEIGVALPEYCYHYGDAVGGKFRSPAFSPDGTQLAWEEGDGIYIGPIPDFGPGCSMPEIEGPLVIPGGSYPDWGPAGIPSKPTGPTERPVLRAAGKPKLRAALKKGLLLNATGIPAGTKVTASIAKAVAKKAKLGRKAMVVAKGSVDSGSKVRLRFTKRTAKKLGKLKTVPLKVSSGGGIKAGLKITLRG